MDMAVQTEVPISRFSGTGSASSQRFQAYSQESEKKELAVVWFGRFVLGYWIGSIGGRARLGHNRNWRVEDRSPRVTISRSPARRFGLANVD